MFTCFIRYEIEQGRDAELEEYARTWMSLSYERTFLVPVSSVQ